MCRMESNNLEILRLRSYVCSDVLCLQQGGFRPTLIDVGCDGFRSSWNSPDNRRPEYDLDVRPRIF